jgi:hypothetical protein
MERIKVHTPRFSNSIPILLHIVLSLATAPLLSEMDNTDLEALLVQPAKIAASQAH